MGGYPESYAKDAAYAMYAGAKPHIKEDTTEDQLKEWAVKTVMGFIKELKDDYNKPDFIIDEDFIPDLEKSLFDLMVLYQKDPENKEKEDELCKAYETVLIKAGYPETYAKDAAYAMYAGVKPHIKEDTTGDQLKEFAVKTVMGFIKELK